MSDKAIVLEAGDGWAIILLPGGEYKKIKTRRRLQVGEAYVHRNILPVRAMTAAAVILFLVLGTVDFFTVKAYAQFSPGVEIGFNRWDRVITVNTANQEGQELLQGMNLKGRTVEQAINQIADKIMQAKGEDDEIEVICTIDAADSVYNSKLINTCEQVLQNKLNAYSSQITMIKNHNRLTVKSVKQKNKAEENSEKSNADNGNAKNCNSEKSNANNGNAKNGDAENINANNGNTKNGNSEKSNADNGNAKNGNSEKSNADNGNAKNGDAENINANNGNTKNGNSEKSNADNGNAKNGDAENSNANNSNAKKGNTENNNANNNSDNSNANNSKADNENKEKTRNLHSNDEQREKKDK